VLVHTFEPHVGKVDFIPFSLTSYSPHMRTEILATAFNDLKLFFQKLDSNTFSNIDTLSGITNREMARVALIFGFQIDSEYLDDHPEDYSPSDSRYAYHVTAKIQDVRARLAALEEKQSNGKPLISKLEERAEKQRIMREERWHNHQY
jgi:hypothetical protein